MMAEQHHRLAGEPARIAGEEHFGIVVLVHSGTAALVHYYIVHGEPVLEHFCTADEGHCYIAVLGLGYIAALEHLYTPDGEHWCIPLWTPVLERSDIAVLEHSGILDEEQNCTPDEEHCYTLDEVHSGTAVLAHFCILVWGHCCKLHGECSGKPPLQPFLA